MVDTLLFNVDFGTFVPTEVEHVLRTEQGFRNVRLNTAAGASVEAEFADDADRTLVTLIESRQAISLTGTGKTALNAAILLQRSLRVPLRMVDTQYSFDLSLSDYATLDELHAAIATAQGH